MPPQPAHRPRRARAFDLSAGARSAVFALLTAHFLLGAAQVASLPPFEGFDETGHYSSIQQVADLGSVPRLPDARMSQQIGKYAADAPMPYESSPPFDRPDRWTYRRFFGAGDDVVAAGRRAAHDVPEETRHFDAGSVENYIAQHPPLFAAMGGLAAALAARFSLSGWLEGLSTFLGMAAWSSTWSLARPSLAFFVPGGGTVLEGAGRFELREYGDQSLRPHAGGPVSARLLAEALGRAVRSAIAGGCRTAIAGAVGRDADPASCSDGHTAVGAPRRSFSLSTARHRCHRRSTRGVLRAWRAPSGQHPRQQTPARERAHHPDRNQRSRDHRYERGSCHQYSPPALVVRLLSPAPPDANRRGGKRSPLPAHRARDRAARRALGVVERHDPFSGSRIRL